MSVLKPLNGYVLLKPVEEEEILAGNIIIPDLGKEKPAIGEVIAYSDFYNFQTGQFVQTKFDVGDKLLIPKVGSMRVTLGGDEYFLCKTVEVIGIVSEN
jgi:co-chaperonin GroES (HSP10)